MLITKFVIRYVSPAQKATLYFLFITKRGRQPLTLTLTRTRTVTLTLALTLLLALTLTP